ERLVVEGIYRTMILDADEIQRRVQYHTNLFVHAGHFFFLKQKTAYELQVGREFRRVLFRSQHTRHGRRAGDGDEAAGLELEQQQLDGQEDRRYRRGKDRRHAARGSRDEQRLPLHGGQVERLGEQRPEGAAGDDDRSLRAVRT